MRPGEKAHPRESPRLHLIRRRRMFRTRETGPPPNAALGSIGLRGRSAKKRMIRAAYRPSPTSEVGKISSRQDDGTSGRVRRMRCSAARSARTMPLCPPHCPLRPPFVPNAARTPPRRNKSGLAEPSRVRTFVFPREPGQTGVRPCRRIRKTPGKLIPKNGERAA